MSEFFEVSFYKSKCKVKTKTEPSKSVCTKHVTFVVYVTGKITNVILFDFPKSVCVTPLEVIRLWSICM